MQPLGVRKYPREIVGIDYVLPRNDSYGPISVFIMACHLIKMAQFVPCHKEVIPKESTYLFICNYYYRLHGVPRVIIVSATNPKIVGKFWQSFVGKLNTTLHMQSTHRHPCTDGLI